MSRYFPERKDRNPKGSKGAGVYSRNDVVLDNNPAYLRQFTPFNGQRDVSAKSDRAQAVNGGFSGRLPTRDHSNRATPRQNYKTRALPNSMAAYSGSGEIVTKGRKSY